MNARDDLIRRVMDAGLSEHWAIRQVDAYAHELAEKIRQDTTATGEAGDQYALLYADLIDPQAQRA